MNTSPIASARGVMSSGPAAALEEKELTGAP